MPILICPALPAVFRVAMNETPPSALDALKCSESAPLVHLIALRLFLHNRFNNGDDLLARDLHMVFQQLGSKFHITLATRLDELHVFFVRLFANRYLHNLETEIPVAAIMQDAQHLQGNFAMRGQIKRLMESPVQMAPFTAACLVHLFDKLFSLVDFRVRDAGNGFRKNPWLEPKPDIECFTNLVYRQIVNGGALVRHYIQ